MRPQRVAHFYTNQNCIQISGVDLTICALIKVANFFFNQSGGKLLNPSLGIMGIDSSTDAIGTVAVNTNLVALAVSGHTVTKLLIICIATNFFYNTDILIIIIIELYIWVKIRKMIFYNRV